MESTVSYARPVNGHRAKETLIGLVHTTETEQHKISYETASWYTLVDVPAGTYEVVLHEGIGTKWVLVRYHGTIVDEHFVNRLFGSSSVAPKRHIGEPRGCTAQLHPYSAAEAFATNPRWELAEDWSTGFSEYESSYDQTTRRLWHLIAPDGTVKR